MSKGSATLTVLYPTGIDFNLSYYLAEHMEKIVEKGFGPHGLIDWTISKVTQADGSSEPYQIQAFLRFKDKASIETAVKEGGAEVMGDIPNFFVSTADKKPLLLVGEIAGTRK